MKKKLIWMLAAIFFCSINASAQGGHYSDWSINSRAWTTNYFSDLILSTAKIIVTDHIINNSKDSLLAERIIPTTAGVLPVGLKKKGFDVADIHNPYRRAWSSPDKLGDYAVGVDVLYAPSVIGVYGGVYFKSQEIVYRGTGDNLRGFYIQPRLGLSVNFGDFREDGFEAGVFYDALVGCGGSVADTNKDRLKGGLGLDFAFRFGDKNKASQAIIQFSMPLHNFLNKDYAGQSDMDRRVAYIMFSERIRL